MRSMALALAAVFLSLSACTTPPPVAPLQHAKTSDGLRIRFLAAERKTAADASLQTQKNDEAIEALRKAVVADLEKAGYVVVTRSDEPFDLASSWSVGVFVEKHQDPEYREVRMELFEPTKERPVDKIRFLFKPGIAPSSEPARVSHEVVNAVVASPAVEAVAVKKKAKAGPPKQEPASD